MHALRDKKDAALRIKRVLTAWLMIAMMVSMTPLMNSRVEAANNWDPPNLFANAGYEAYDANGLPEMWTTFVPDGTPEMGVDTTIAHEGSASMRIHAAAEARASVTQQVAAQGGVPYELSMWIKLDNIVSSNMGVTVRMQFFDETGTKIGGNLHLDSWKGTLDWQKVQYTVETPPGTAKLQIENFIWAATGTVWFDDVQLLPGGTITAILNPDHPRLLADADDFLAIGQRVSQDPLAANWYESVKQDADSIIGMPVSSYEIPDGLRLLATSREVLRRIYTLGMAYQVEGNALYAERAWEELEAVAAFPDWNPRHFLDTAEMTHAFAIGYDWFYDYWSETRKEAIRHAIATMGLMPGLQQYESAWWPNAVSNWNMVCNGGLAAGAMAIGDVPEYRYLADEILRKGLDSVQKALDQFMPDGGWYEGYSYWDYATQYLTLHLAGMQSALGTDFGLSARAGLAETGQFPIYMEGPIGQTYNYSDASPDSTRAPQLMWMAQQYNLPAYQWFSERTPGRAEGLLWYRENAYEGPRKEGLAKDRYFSNIDVALFRSTWEDRNALFAGIKGAYSDTSHKQLDAGEFVLDALGVRWAKLLGADNYNLPGYFDTASQRWTYYRNRAEGSNTLVINPGMGPEQDIRSAAEVIDYRSDLTEAYAIVDLQPVYSEAAVKAERGIKLLDHRRQFLVQDEVVLTEPSDIWWFMHTGAYVEEVSPDGKTAILSQGGKRLWMRILSAQGEFTIMDAEPLPASPDPAGQNPNIGTKKVAVHVSDTMGLELSILMVPLHEWEEAPTDLPSVVPLSQWAEAQENVSLLESVTLDGEAMSEFAEDTFTYHMKLPAEATTAPAVGAAASNAAASVSVSQAAELPGTAWIEVQNAPGGDVTRYAIHFEREESNDGGDSGLPVAAVTASSDDGNIPENTLDGDFATRWSAEGDGEWIQYDLGGTTTVKSVSLAWFRGNERSSIFDITLSEDGTNWTTVYSGSSSGDTLELENYDIGEHNARYVKIIGHGNTSNLWNSILETRIHDIVIPGPQLPVRLDSVALSASADTIDLGNSLQLAVSGELTDGTPADMSVTEVTYYSDRPDVIALSPSGLAEAVGDGTAKITVMVKDGWLVKMASMQLTAKDPSMRMPLHDSFVRDGAYSGDNYGSDSTLLVKASIPNNGYNRISYLQFDASSIPAGTMSVTLNVQGYIGDSNGTEADVYVHKVADDSWTEQSLTWSNQPAIGAEIAVEHFNDVSSWHEIDITDYVLEEAAGDGIVSLALKQNGTGYVLVLHSKEHVANKPALQFHTDNTAPQIAIVEPAEVTYRTADELTPLFTVTDEESGVDSSRTVAAIGGVTVDSEAAIPLYTLSLGLHVFTVTASDNAGNTSSRSVTFRTEASMGSLHDLLIAFAREGWIDNKDVWKNLSQKLQQDNLKAFIYEVEAQSGKHITAEAAAYLLRDANALLGGPAAEGAETEEVAEEATGETTTAVDDDDDVQLE
ncbi:DNRLRE domain-containing protein [Paenibacillus sp. J5C_2022]|uniref:CBM96 family carbohydrate-binding protein n=1 Tax=Paenibacillus sp. J5C2022 TaxID=2977129 RepID=UPI0021D1CB28|nr:DNRLRE domain-containing protein [Paenibacillus sp. J5C2022]MCU6707934.1 DNRLRE domain-containing protein [Paenibacillus sp. J5C2022]